MAQHIKTLINQYLKTNKHRQTQLKRVKEILKETINQKILKQTEIEVINKDQITLLPKTSSGAYQLKLQEETIIQTIKKEIPELKKVKIEVR